MLVLILFAFFAGIATIAAPCILPILPVVLSAGVSGGKQRPLGIILGLVVSFSFFTLSLSYLVSKFGLDPDVLRNAAIGILLIFGLLMLVPKVFTKFEVWISALLPKKSFTSSRKDFWGGVLVGISLGLVWTPCVGPIVASVITLAATSTVSFASVFITLAYAIGTGLPLLILMYSGQNVLKKVRGFSKHSGVIQQIFGLVMVVTAVSMIFGFDRTLQTALLAKIPSNFTSGLTQQLEQSDIVKEELKKLKNDPESSVQKNLSIVGGAASGLANLGKAPEITGISHWLNSDPVTLASLKGKVVLIDFWTYSCINCVRTLPYITNWYETYKSEGFVVIGVHAPEFAFEKDTENVAAAIRQHGITYPVAQDNDFATWRAYSNQYWPAHYLIDAEGNVRYTHFGEGSYDETEANIRSLLAEKKGAMLTPSESAKKAEKSPNRNVSPETYLGTARRANYVQFAENTDLGESEWTLSGKWQEEAPYIENQTSQEELSMKVRAQDIYLVLNPPKGQTANVIVSIDGVETKTLSVSEDGLYTLAEFSKVEYHMLTLRFETPGTKAFAFTFG